MTSPGPGDRAGALIVASHALALALELTLLYAFARLGWSLSTHAVIRGAVAVGLVGAAVWLWGRFAAPRSPARREGVALVAFKIAAFALGSAALVGTGMPRAGLLFAGLAGVHLGLAARLGVL